LLLRVKKKFLIHFPSGYVCFHNISDQNVYHQSPHSVIPQFL
jgi:hypothetical protein